MIGIVPAAGAGQRIQPLAFSKEMLPVGSRLDDDGLERPRAVSEYLVERMVLAGADRVCFVVSPEKGDVLRYYARHPAADQIFYVVQERPLGLCDALFRAASHVRADEDVLIGLPDTVWFPIDGFSRLAGGELSFLTFPVPDPERFDAVVTEGERVVAVEVKQPAPRSRQVWGAFRMPGSVYHALHALWRSPARNDEYVGTLVNAYLAEGGRARAVAAGERYFDVGTIEGYRAAVAALAEAPSPV